MEESLFDILGNPVAYISYDNDNTIYMWDGRPVAYLEPTNTIYGFNGRHLGWFENGRVRNLRGEICGFNKMAADIYTGYEPYKAYKQYRPYRSYKEYVHYKPYFGYTKSNESLSQFLIQGTI